MMKFIVDIQSEKLNVDRFLRTHCAVSARTLAKLKRIEGGIKVNDNNARSIDLLSLGDVVTLNLPEDSSSGVVAIRASLDILFEDDYLLIVNKPPFMPVHPTKQHQTDTLANAVKFYAESKGEIYAFRAVNRLDRNTSGAVLIAKNRHVAYNLSESEVFKEYIALCEGHIDEEGTINLPIGLADDSKMLRVVRLDGKAAVTHYKPIEVYDKFTKLSINLETGRTHQIRCHMAHLGHPLMGDDLYGGSQDKINRHALHCAHMNLIHPVTGERISVFAKLFEDMNSLIYE